jgi:hypothetical protein
MRIVDDIE